MSNEKLAAFGYATIARDPQVAAAVLAEVVAREPTQARYRAAYSVALSKCGKTTAALESLEASVAADPTFLEAWCILAELAMDNLEWTRASKALARCLALDPKGEHPSGLRARALIKKGEKLTRPSAG